MKRHRSQNAMVLDHLRNAPLTQNVATSMHGCARLAAVVYRLRRDGYNIVTEMVPQPGGSPYARYHLKMTGLE